MRIKLGMALLLIVGAGLLAACGGGGSATATPTTPPQATPTATTAPSTGDPVAGQQKFGTCAGCHGSDAMGITGLGKSLVGTEFIESNDDQELLAFIKVGRPASDPANTTGVDMPPKGGNPALQDADLLDIIAYIRSLQ